MVRNMTNTSDWDGYQDFVYKYSLNPKDFNVDHIRPYDPKDEIKNTTLIKFIYDYIALEIAPIVNFDIFTDRLCDSASDKLEKRVDTKFENGFRYLKVRLACGYDGEEMTEVELSQDVVDCYYHDGEVVFNGNTILVQNPWGEKAQAKRDHEKVEEIAGKGTTASSANKKENPAHTSSKKSQTSPKGTQGSHGTSTTGPTPPGTPATSSTSAAPKTSGDTKSTKAKPHEKHESDHGNSGSTSSPTVTGKPTGKTTTPSTISKSEKPPVDEKAVKM
ncbi:uncharacterized protein LOC142357312 [Convolutriloba macropyga]|uniref:uncharacterized protein LOC142357312 n=1 Tax=Convolutriloba macropyga TaxID=536237 RepID=UPI003F526448